MRPYGYASGNSYHHSRQHTGRQVLQWPSEDKDRSRNQRQQSGRVARWPKIVVHFALHRFVVIHFYEEKAEIIVIFLAIFSGVLLRFEMLYQEMVMRRLNNKPIILVVEAWMLLLSQPSARLPPPLCSPTRGGGLDGDYRGAGEPHILPQHLERRADGDGRPGKRGDLWPLSVVACGGVRSGIGSAP
jgi:hypothetical protein